MPGSSSIVNLLFPGATEIQFQRGLENTFSILFVGQIDLKTGCTVLICVQETTPMNNTTHTNRIIACFRIYTQSSRSSIRWLQSAKWQFHTSIKRKNKATKTSNRSKYSPATIVTQIIQKCEGSSSMAVTSYQ